MEENGSLTSTFENSRSLVNVKSFVHNFEQSTQNSLEKDGHSDPCKKRETMKQTSFRKLQDLKKNLEQSMHQRYQSNKNIKKIGKPISELKEALKKSMENLTSGSFSVNLRNKGSSDHLNTSSFASPSLKNRRFSLGSPKFKPIPLPIPKPKTSYNNKKYKSISDLCDRRESAIVEDIEFNETNNDFESSRLSYDCSTPLKYFRHSESLSNSSRYSSQHSEVFNESPDISTRNSILSYDYMLSPSTITSSSKLFSNQSNKLCQSNCLMFEPIGETCTDDLENEPCDLLPNENINQATTNGLSIALNSDTNGLEYEETNNDETLHSSMNFHVDINTSESSDNEDAIQNGSYYISQEELPNEYETEIIESHFPAETNSALSTAEINVDVEKSLKNFSLQSPSELLQPTSFPGDFHIISSDTFNVEQPPSLNNSNDNSTQNQEISKLSMKKPCLKVSPLQNNQASYSKPNTNEEVSSFETTKQVEISPTINASPILNQPLCCSIHHYFQTILASLQTIEQSDIFDIDILTNLYTKPFTVFDRVSDVFFIHYQSPNQPIQHPILQNSTNEKLVELGEDLIRQVDVLMTDNKTEMEAPTKYFSQLKEMLCESMEDERKEDVCMRKVKELLVQIDSVTCLLLLLNKMLSRKQYYNLKEIHKTQPGEAVEIKLSDAKELKGTLDEKYYSMFSYLSKNSNQQTCDFFLNLIQNNLCLKFEKEYLSHISFQLQRLLNLFRISFES